MRDVGRSSAGEVAEQTAAPVDMTPTTETTDETASAVKTEQSQRRRSWWQRFVDRLRYP